MHNYGLILKQLRQLNGDSLKTAAKKIQKSVGWLSEIENGHGHSKLKQIEFERIVKLFGGEKHRELFKTWVALEKTKDKTDRTLDGAVLRHVREKCDLTLIQASEKIGISKRYLSNMENGHKPIKFEMRNRIMRAYGYSPTSFRNLSANEKRSKSVPVRYKINSLLNQLEDMDLQLIFEFISDSILSRPKSTPHSFLNENQ